MNEAVAYNEIPTTIESAIGLHLHSDSAPSVDLPGPANYYAGVWIEGPHLPEQRPDARRAEVIHWEAVGIVIPWPEGMTAKQAVEAWVLGRATDILNTGISKETP